MENIKHISREMNIPESRVSAVARMLEQGDTIPFIARYRKELTGSLDELAIAGIRDLKDELDALANRKEAILKSLTERDLLTDLLLASVRNAASMTDLEDIYEKYRPKKRTRAMIARENNLEPLAMFLLEQSGRDPLQEAQNYIRPETEIKTADQALAGARDIIAEIMNENISVRAGIRKLFFDTAMIYACVKKGKEEEGIKFRDYFDWSEPVGKTPSHRFLAMLRGQNEAVLSVRVQPDEDLALQMIERQYIKNQSASSDQVRLAVKDGYKRLLSKSIEKECINEFKIRADDTAIQVFVSNLKELLLSPPLGQKRIMAVDPGIRTGCKVVCLDAQGNLLYHDVIFLHQGKDDPARQIIHKLVKAYDIEAIAIGNGTAGRETEAFVRSLGLDATIHIVMVDESGASIYSASKAARDEFPDHDITVRGAVSIGRRLMDPLAELVKLDPKSIGVGQYQHDVDQKRLQKSLDDAVEFCVNRVGVEANTASRELLSRVSGLNDTIAANMVLFRNENGPFRSRKDFLKVPRLGPKAFEQAAGFLRIHHSTYPLDRSGIHPESYPVVEKMARDAAREIAALMDDPEAVKQILLHRYVTDHIGMPTLEDIIKELLSPGRDPRKVFENFSFDETIHDIKDLVPGMKVPGIVTNVTAFGAFVDIGVHQDGLIHISRMARRFIKDPKEVVSVRQTVEVTILEIDVKRKRISLSLID